MEKEKKYCYIVKSKDNSIFKFSYNEHMGIYCEIYIKEAWSESSIVYRDSLEEFYVEVDEDGGIYVFCQDICGDIILCSLEESNWKSENLLSINQHIITPLYMRAFLTSGDIHLFYNVLDKYNRWEVVIHQITNKKELEVVGRLDYLDKEPYAVVRDCNLNFYLLHARFDETYQLSSRKFYNVEGRWGKEETIYKSTLPYKDFTACVSENKIHYLFIAQEDGTNRVIYQSKNIETTKNHMAFQQHNMDSCMLYLSKSALWVLWTSENTLYGSFSNDDGESFSSVKVYKQFNRGKLIKVGYKEYKKNNQHNYKIEEVYAININGEVKLFLEELLEDSLAADMECDKVSSDIESTEYFNVDKMKEDYMKINATADKYKGEKDELNNRLKKAEIENRKLYEALECEKKHNSGMEYDLFKEKEKYKEYIKENAKLKDRVNYLDQMLITKNKEYKLLEKSILEKDKENKKLREQIQGFKVENLDNEDKNIKQNISDNSKKTKFSFIKWLLDEESN
jgi:hypothetical protein